VQLLPFLLDNLHFAHFDKRINHKRRLTCLSKCAKWRLSNKMGKSGTLLVIDASGRGGTTTLVCRKAVRRKHPERLGASRGCACVDICRASPFVEPYPFYAPQTKILENGTACPTPTRACVFEVLCEDVSSRFWATNHRKSAVGNSPPFLTNLPFHDFPKYFNHD